MGVPDSPGCLTSERQSKICRRATRARGRTSACRGPALLSYFATRAAVVRIRGSGSHYKARKPASHSRGRPPASTFDPLAAIAHDCHACPPGTQLAGATRRPRRRRAKTGSPSARTRTFERRAREEKKNKTGDGSTSSLERARLSRERVSLESVSFSLLSRVREKHTRSKADALSLSLSLTQTRERAREMGGDLVLERERREWLCDRRPKKSLSHAGNV